MRWFRWYEGTTEDGKFRVTARNASVTVRDVIAVWAVILEDASSDKHRGICHRSTDYIAAVLDLDHNEVYQIISEMKGQGILKYDDELATGIEVTNWKTRQYETDIVDSTNTERQRRYREKHKRNGTVTDNNGTITETKRPDTESETDKKDGASAPPSLEKQYFDRCHEVLKSRSLGGRLLASKNKDIALARAVVEMAATKSNPAEYVAKVCNKAAAPQGYMEGIV